MKTAGVSLALAVLSLLIISNWDNISTILKRFSRCPRDKNRSFPHKNEKSGFSDRRSSENRQGHLS